MNLCPNGLRFGGGFLLRMVGLEPPSGLGSCELAVVQLFCEQGAGREEIIAHQHERDGRVFTPGPRTRHSHHVHKTEAGLAEHKTGRGDNLQHGRSFLVNIFSTHSR